MPDATQPLTADLCLWLDVPEADRLEMRRFEEDALGPPDRRRPTPGDRLAWAELDPPDSWLIRVRDGCSDHRLVSRAFVIRRTIVVGGRSTRAAGLRGVLTHPAHRRRGAGSAGMRRAAHFIWDELCPDIALLLSSTMAVPFYERLGWRVVPGTVFCDQPDGRLNYSAAFPDCPAMVLLPAASNGEQSTAGPPRPSQPAFADEIDLCGLPW